MKLSFIRFLPGIAWFFIVLYIMCLPGNDIPKIGWLNAIYFDKWVHVGVFGLLVILFCIPFYYSNYSKKERLRYFIKIAIAASIWGLTIEFIQRFWVPGRSYDLLDWAADSAGAGIAWWLCRLKLAGKGQAGKL